MSPIVVTNSSPSGRLKRVRGASSGVVAPDWEIVRNFNDGTPGTVANGTADGFNSEAGNSKYTTDQSFEGGQSCELNATIGDTGFGTWGGTVTFTSEMVKGDDLWIQLRIRIPAGFVIDTINGGGPAANGSLKYFRTRQLLANGSLTGHFDLQFQDDALSGTNAFRMIKEGQGGGWTYFGPPGPVVRDTWITHTLHQKLDDVLPASGGTARTRFWQDSSLLVDNDTIKPIVNATDRVIAFYLFTYWNGAPTQTQKLYVDQIRIAKNGVPSWAADLT